MRRVGRRDAAAMTVAAITLVATIAGAGLVVVSAQGRAARARPLVDCSQAATRVAVVGSVDLDPTCTYTAGFDITTSDTTLDCRGALIESPSGAGGVGILVTAPVDTDLARVTVRNCRVRGFLNSIRITRDGFRTLPAGGEYVHGTADITVEDSDVRDSRGVGIFVDGYVAGVSVARTHVEGAGSSGIYLDGGSKDNAILDSEIVGNGFRENGPGGQQFTLGGTTYWFWGVGREGISLDGSSHNTVRGNHIEGNSAGGVFVYKNCGEYPNSGRYFERRTPSEHNWISDNDIVGGRNGVWIGSRMAENTLPMACTDPAYVDEPARRVVLDRAAHNTVVTNRFTDVTYGVRVEDDDTTVAGNTFAASSPDHHAVIIGTPLRAEVLGRPVVDTHLLENRSLIVGNPDPYRWIPGAADSEVAGNLALGRSVGICEAPPIPRQAFIFVIAVQVADPSGVQPPTPDLTVPTLGALPACDRGAPPTSSTTTTTAPVTGPAAPDAAPAGPVPAGPAYTG